MNIEDICGVLEALFGRDQPAITQAWNDDIHSVDDEDLTLYNFGMINLGGLFLLRGVIHDGVSDNFSVRYRKTEFRTWLNKKIKSGFIDADVDKIMNLPDDTKEFGNDVTADQVWKFIEDNYDDFEDALEGNN